MADLKTPGQFSGKSLFGTETNPSNIMPSKLGPDSRLKFRCHPKVSCFTACCGNINIILTPYDILRIRRALNLPASEFLLRFTTPVYLEKTDMPGVKIHLDQDGRCPFVTRKAAPSILTDPQPAAIIRLACPFSMKQPKAVSLKNSTSW